jgi:hypothetical protein
VDCHQPRVNLTRFHGVLAPNSTPRVQVTPAKRGKGNKVKTPDQLQDPTPAERRASMTWAQRLKRVFNIDIETCRECGGAVKVIACLEDPVVIEKMLIPRNEKRPQPQQACCQKNSPGANFRVSPAGVTRRGKPQSGERPYHGR